MTKLQLYLLLAFCIMNVFAYIVMWRDKLKAIQKKNRIPETQLLLIALLFGASGIYLGMKKPLYHKAAKSKFKILIPLLMLVNHAVIIYFTVIR